MIPFAELRQRVTAQDAVEFLGLKFVRSDAKNARQHRYSCPKCKTADKDPLAINMDTLGFTCFATPQRPHGTDAVGLVAHCRDVSMSEAAKMLADHFLTPVARAAPPIAAEAPTSKVFTVTITDKDGQVVGIGDICIDDTR
ncbi:hypothetical protein [Rhodopseudomonas palustris]|uniref:hypothetical protein n=1 Tax=Rhodopseudomonas palustris TaxID=1076 RepID=UPI000D19C7F0|nr:hypothetical protein [Rhodopseudomonas palustris]AVT83685.1 hypothetical protein RPYSC3_48250 [Rhodopseudomonas palustris]